MIKFNPESDSTHNKKPGIPRQRIVMKKRVITYQSPSGNTLSLCAQCIASFESAGNWPFDENKQDYCTVSRGLHSGVCNICKEHEDEESDQYWWAGV